MRLTTGSVTVDTGCRDRTGVALFRDGALMAIFVRLDEAFHDARRGRWFLEVGFGACADLSPEPFEYISDGIAWTATCCGCPPPPARAFDELELSMETAIVVQESSSAKRS